MTINYGKLVLSLLLCVNALVFEVSSLECTSDGDCESEWPGTKCLKGRCSNPFASGCFRAMSNREGQKPASDIQELLFSKRVCNTNDDSSSGYCEEGVFDYPEIVVHNANWESVIFYSWIIQIFLMEFLKVPARVGLGKDSPISSFYNLENQDLQYSAITYPFEALDTANSLDGDCSLTDEPCVHVLPEVWAGQEQVWEEYFDEGKIDTVEGNGIVGEMGWYVPRFTAEKYPHLTSFHGLSNNREELAEIFKRPTTWKDYCTEVSKNKCSTPDSVASDYPSTEENDFYYKEGLFTGYFRHTSQNNCTQFPDTCTGHIGSPPCDWSTFVEQQTYWLNISLESSGKLFPNNGYTYSQIHQINKAAAETSSHLAIWWWKPDYLFGSSHATHAEPQPIMLPERTPECGYNRAGPDDRCNGDINVRRGSKDGACGQDGQLLKKIIAMSLRNSAVNTPVVDRSPGYQAVKNIKIDDVHISSLLNAWTARGQTGNAAREVICEFMVDREEDFWRMAPFGYPWISENDTSAAYSGPLFVAAVSLAVAALVYIMCLSMSVYVYRRKTVMTNAQILFLAMVLFGFFLISVSSVLYPLKPSTGVCSTKVWFQLLGYTFFLVPLIVKLTAINRLMLATKRMRRIKIHPYSLYAKVAAWVLLVMAFLIIYQVIDPPTDQYNSFLQKSDTADESDTVHTTYRCGSDSSVFAFCMVAYSLILTIFATILSFQSRAFKSKFNETKDLSTMMYSHFIFSALRGIFFFVFETDLGTESGELALEPARFAAINSMLMSLDVIMAASIYVLKKVMRIHNGEDGDNSARRRSVSTKGRTLMSLAVQQIETAAQREHHAYRASLEASGKSKSWESNMNLSGSLAQGSRRESRVSFADEWLPSSLGSSVLQLGSHTLEADAQQMLKQSRSPRASLVSFEEDQAKKSVDPRPLHETTENGEANEHQNDAPVLVQMTALEDNTKNNLVPSHLEELQEEVVFPIKDTPDTHDRSYKENVTESEEAKDQKQDDRSAMLKRMRSWRSNLSVRERSSLSVPERVSASSRNSRTSTLGNSVASFVSFLWEDNAEIEYESSSERNEEEESLLEMEEKLVAISKLLTHTITGKVDSGINSEEKNLEVASDEVDSILKTTGTCDDCETITDIKSGKNEQQRKQTRRSDDKE